MSHNNNNVRNNNISNLNRFTNHDEREAEQSENMLSNNYELSKSVPSNLKDKFYLTYFLFYALGTLTAVPNNFFTTANDYWMYKFRNITLDGLIILNDNNQVHQQQHHNEGLTTSTVPERTGLQADFTSTFSIVSNVSNVAFLILTILIRRRVSLFTRLVAAISLTLLLFAITVGFVNVSSTDNWQRGFFAFTMAIGALLTAASATFTLSVFEMVSRFPPMYLAAILSGQSICGIFAALVQIFSLSIGATSTISGFVYFLCGMFFVFSTLIFLITMHFRSDFFQYFMNRTNRVDDAGNVNVNNNDAIDEDAGKAQLKEVMGKIWRVFGKVKYYIASMLIVLGCSIMIHPAVTSLVQSVDKGHNNKWSDVYFVPVVTFLLYNVLDFIGRESAGKLKTPKNGILILLVSFLRIGFVPMIMLCNAQPRSHLPVPFNADWPYIVFIIIFAFTNGYLVNLCVIHVPYATAPSEKKIAMGVIVVTMFVGLGACSFLSAILVKAL